MSRLVVAIDGPAGAGKSTVAKRVAHALGLNYLDTGAMYRALALKAQRMGLDPSDGEEAGRIGARTSISFGAGDPQVVFLDGEDVSTAIRTLDIGELASALSAHSAVRQVMAGRQKELVSQGGVVLEGRDTTTVIAPEAEVKVYLTASPEVRARRRCLELEGKGESPNYEDVLQRIQERDHRDTTRQDSPLKVAEDASVIETDKLTVDEVVERILQLARSVAG